ncbi:UxaA family hydrolase [Calorimonas adulescens]|uniref:UxaA family hydrolase n=1 Tax=Calorimonas adulescens TaxID=2606906 RepID=A0A5D8QBA7_9THEO|nr:UxaA family hydrolase [Calorimonas adulescens]TZE81066.1 UxaA family hydrolase [Calorimonas adulescens]
MKRFAVVANAKDNVATAVKELEAAEKVLLDVDGGTKEIVLNQKVPFGHKFAITEIKKGEEVIKYGETIGRATSDIYPGDYVHVHNVESERGRGDWK